MSKLINRKFNGIYHEDIIQFGHLRVPVNGTISFSTSTDENGLVVRSVNNNTVPETTIAKQQTATYTLTDTILDISSKYSINTINGSNMGSVDISLFRFCPLSTIVFATNGGAYGDISNLIYGGTIKITGGLNIRNTNISGDISSLAGHINMPLLELNVSATRIGGDLATLLGDASYVKKINIMYSLVTTTQATLDAFSAAGVEVACNQDQIIG